MFSTFLTNKFGFFVISLERSLDIISFHSYFDQEFDEFVFRIDGMFFVFFVSKFNGTFRAESLVRLVQKNMHRAFIMMSAYTGYIRQFLPVVHIFVEQWNAPIISESLSGFLQRKFLHAADYRTTPVGCQDEFLHNLWISNDMNPNEPKRTQENQIQPNPTKRFRVSTRFIVFPLSFRQCSLCFRQCSLISKTVIDPRARVREKYIFSILMNMGIRCRTRTPKKVSPKFSNASQ